jgi:hypothetical protein
MAYPPCRTRSHCNVQVMGCYPNELKRCIRRVRGIYFPVATSISPSIHIFLSFCRLFAFVRFTAHLLLHDAIPILICFSSFANSGLITVGALFVVVHTMGRTPVVSNICHKVSTVPLLFIASHSFRFTCASYIFLLLQAFGNSSNPKWQVVAMQLYSTMIYTPMHSRTLSGAWLASSPSLTSFQRSSTTRPWCAHSSLHSVSSSHACNVQVAIMMPIVRDWARSRNFPRLTSPLISPYCTNFCHELESFFLSFISNPRLKIEFRLASTAHLQFKQPHTRESDPSFSFHFPSLPSRVV